MTAIFFDSKIIAEKLKPLLDKTHDSLSQIRLQIITELNLPPAVAKTLMFEITLVFVLNLLNRVVIYENALIEKAVEISKQLGEERKIGS